MDSVTSIIIDVSVLVFASVGLLTSAGLIFIVFYHRQRYPVGSPTLLVFNTYLSVILICFILLDMYGHNLYGDLFGNVSFENWWCRGRAYLLHVTLCSLYYSYLLQAIFRFFRVILHKHKQLQTYRYVFPLMIGQWLLSFLCMLPVLLLNYFEYVPQYYYCEILLSNTRGLLLMDLLSSQIPMATTGSIYFSIVYHMKKTKNQLNLQNRQQANQRDIVVLRRIIILLSLLVILAFPTSVMWMNYIATGYVNPIGYHMGWLTFTFSLSIIPGISAFLTPQLRELFGNIWVKNQRVQPAVIRHGAELNGSLTRR